MELVTRIKVEHIVFVLFLDDVDHRGHDGQTAILVLLLVVWSLEGDWESSTMDVIGGNNSNSGVVGSEGTEEA